MTHSVIVKPSGYSFVVNDNETVLEAALRCGYFFPHNCRMGACATCKGKVLEGEIDYDGLEILGLTKSQQSEGYALFCSAKPKTDLIIEVNNVCNVKVSSPVALYYEVIHQEQLAADISQIILKSPAHEYIPYQSGQYIKVLHSDQRISPMSIACASFDLSVIELHLFHPAENTQAQDVLRMIKENRKLLLRGPYGVCTASKIEKDRPVIFLVRGTGFAPVKAVIEELLQVKECPAIHLYWCDVNYLAPLVEEWSRELKNLRYTSVLSRSMIELLLEEHPDLSRMQIYMVDSPEAVYAALFRFMEHGLSKEWFYSDVLDYDEKI